MRALGYRGSEAATLGLGMEFGDPQSIQLRGQSVVDHDISRSQWAQHLPRCAKGLVKASGLGV
jgi:hypothetical protein